MYSAGSEVPWRVPRGTRHTLHLLKTWRGVYAIRAEYSASRCVSESRATEGISSETAGLSTRDNEEGTATNEHGRDAGVRTSPRRTAR